MPYLGQRPSKGDENNFKILDDISSYTLTFDGSDSSVVSAANDTITSLTHRFVQGQRVTYNKGGGTVIAGLSDGVYYIIKEDHNTIKLATSASNAANGIAVNITNVGSGSSHTLNVAFDGVNTKFKATHTNGQKARITRSAQLVISINGVIQQPHDSATPSTGFGFDLDGTIVLSQAPVAGDVYWAHVLTNNNVTFDISDNDVDNFTGNGSTVSFNLSKTPPDNRNVLVTIDGVVQYPNDPDGTARAYTVVENVLTFTTAPASATEIQVRHIGFAGSTSGSGSGGVTSFYGRTGAVVLKSTDNIVANNATFSGNLTVDGTTTTLDTVLTEVDKLEVAANNSTVGAAITQSGSGDIVNLFDGNTEVLTVTDGGKVGILSAIPEQRLTVAGVTDITHYPNTTINNNRLQLGFNAPEGYIKAKNSTGSPAANIALYTTDTSGNTNRIMHLRYNGDVGIGTNSPRYTNSFDIFGKHLTLSETFPLSWMVGNSSTFRGRYLCDSGGNFVWQFGSSTEEKVRFKSNGNVGIGTANPVTKLHLDGGNLTIRNGTAAGVILDEMTGVGGSLKVTTASGYGSFGPGNTTFCHVQTDRTGGFYFNRRVTVDEGIVGSYDEDLQLHSPINTPRVYIDKDNGNMGIGTHTPSSGKLQVQDGGIAVRGAATPNINFSPTDGSGGNADISYDGNDLKIISNSSGANVRIGAYSKLNHIVVKANGHIGIHTDNPSNSQHLTITGASNYEAGIFYKQANVNQYRFMTEGGTGNVYYDVYGIGGDANGDHIFRTKAKSGATEAFRINENGQITTRGAAQTGFNNAGNADFGSFLTVNGGHTSNQWGILSLEGNSSASGYSVGSIQFINQNNANSSSGANTQSRLLAKIDVYTETSDSNAGDDSGGTLRIFTKPEAANPTERLTIRGSGNIGINQSSPSTNLEVCPTDGAADTATIFINAKTHDTNAQSEAILKFGYGHSGSPDGVGHIKMVEDANNSFDADFIFGLPINNNSGGSVTNERVRITSEGQIRVQGTYNGSSSTSNTFPVLNINNLQGSYTADNIIGGVTFGKAPGHTSGIRAGMLALYSNTGSNSSNVGTDLVFRTANECAGDSNEKLRITSGGAVVANNFGIGVDNRWKIRPNSSYNNLALEYSTGTSLADTNIKAEFYNTGNVRFSTDTGSANGLKIYQNSIESQIYTAHFPELLTTGNPNPTGDAAGRMPYSTISGNNVTIAANTYYVAMAGRKFYLPALSSTTINNNCSLYFDLNTMSYVNNASGIIESTVTRIVLYYNANSGTGAVSRIVPLCNKMTLMAVKKMYISCVTATTDVYTYSGSVDSWRGDLWQTGGAANASNGSDYVRYLYQNNGYSLVEGRYYLFWGRSPRAFNQYVNEGYMETGSRDSYNFGTGASQFWMQGASYWASGGVGSCLDLGVQTIVHA